MSCRHSDSAQQRLPSAQAVGPMLGPYALTNCAGEPQAAEPRLPAPRDGRPGGGQRLTPDAPHNGGKPSTQGWPPASWAALSPPAGRASQRDSARPPRPHTRAHSRWVADPNSPPRGRAAGGGRAPEPRRPSPWHKAPPPGTPSRHPHSAPRRLARAHAVGRVLGPHAHTNHAQETRATEPSLAAPRCGRLGEGQRLTPDTPHSGGRPTPPGQPPTTPAARSPPQGMQA